MKKNKIICGIKFTHDGSVALIEGNKLVFCIEIEKIRNNPRYSSILDINVIEELLVQHGYTLDHVDEFVVDGWEGVESSFVEVPSSTGETLKLQVAPYREQRLKHDILQRYRFDGLKIGNRSFPYSSFMHVTGHIMSAYCSSPFAKRNESSFVLVWDGGMFPRLYYVDRKVGAVECMGKLFFLIGSFYAEFATYFHPFIPKVRVKDSLSVAGKVMAYIAMGQPREEIVRDMETLMQKYLEISMTFVETFALLFREVAREKKYDDADVLASMHVFLERQLISGLKEKIAKYGDREHNICFAGGCALNIKWNSAIRSAGIFKEMWVPPFPNDSGSAIGVACAGMVSFTSQYDLDWNVYSGPDFIIDKPSDGWDEIRMSIAEVASLLDRLGEPILLLQGRAELGPRSLGNRSIIAPTKNSGMKEVLNKIKCRESYRPVAPICLVEDAPHIFNPGTPDPYMLFDHAIRPDWIRRIPAVKHVDGTARLQTVDRKDNAVLYDLLFEYKKLTGIGVLCNTSANHKDKGFFPDVSSASAWNEVNFIWSDGRMFFKKGYELFLMQSTGHESELVVSSVTREHNTVIDF